jgi:hypothetical protein
MSPWAAVDRPHSTAQQSQKVTPPMQPFTIRVLGGQFTVLEIVPRDDRSPAELIDLMLSIPPERWFVVLDEDSEMRPRDALALIDDEFQFQTLAVGTFQGEE